MARTLPRPAARRSASSATAHEAASLVHEMLSHIWRRSSGESLLVLTELGMTLAQFVTLKVLRMTGAQSLSAIAACVRLSPAATSHLVDRLVGMNFVGRAEDQDDRRQKRITITPAGAELVDRLMREQTTEFADVLGRIPPEQQRALSAVLRRVIGELSSLPEKS